MKGVEPIRLAALDPKSSASASSATSAGTDYIIARKTALRQPSVQYFETQRRGSIQPKIETRDEPTEKPLSAFSAARSTVPTGLPS